MSEPLKINDATLLGEVDDAVLDTEIVFGFGGRNAEPNFKNVTLSVEQFVERLSKFEIGPKDGTCILQGETNPKIPERAKTNRGSKQQIKNHILSLDVDNGTPIAEVIEKVKGTGLFAVIYTTHSHMKTATEVPESQLARFGQQRGVTQFFEDDEIVSLAVDYLRTDKGYRPEVLAEAALIERKMNNGITYVIGHKPMPKCRIVFVLDEPFWLIKGGLQQARIDAWKKFYEHMAAWLDIPIDRSCSDPARLFYLPRKGSAISPGEIYIVPGGKLQVGAWGASSLRNEGSEVGPSGPTIAANFLAALEGNGASTRSDGSGDFVPATPGLMQFVKECPDFDILNWLEMVAPEDARRGGPALGKHWTCPNEDHHTNPSPDDTAFAVYFNPDGSGWGAHCMHDGCVQASKKDRLWFLDAMCVKYGVKHANELRVCSEIAREGRAKVQDAAKVASNPDALQAAVDNLSDTSTDSEIETVCQALGAASEFARAKHLKTVSRKTGVPLPDLKKTVRRLAAEAENQKKIEAAEDGIDDGAGSGGNGSGGHAVPADLEDADCVWLDWPWDVQVYATIAILNKKNRREPFLFRRVEGGIIWVQKGVDGRMKATPVGGGEWMSLLTKMVPYKETDLMTGLDKIVTPPKAIVMTLQGTEEFEFPEFRSISRVALFGEDGTLRTQKGYDPALKIYLDPVYEPEPVPAVPTQDDVDAAVGWLFEAIRDFPFSDKFDGTEDAPVKLDVLDEDGYREVNWERGMSSRANCLAMLIQPFARNLITGPTPAYHIDKSSPGTGAGYLADTAFIITEGRSAEIQTMSLSNEEFRKAITATLRNGASIIFVDNINRNVDSGDLAAALTSGTWRDRILGKTEMTTIPVTAMWMMAGNNLTFSHELMRRNVPIRMDASTKNPAFDRGKADFKHFPLQPWLMENRRWLVWACHILIANWIAKGRPPGSALMNSFDSWSMTMSGILEAAEIPGFLVNVRDYLEVKDMDDSASGDVAERIAIRFGTELFSASEAFEALKDPLSGTFTADIFLAGNDEHTRTISFGKWLAKHFAGATFELDPTKAYPTGHGFVVSRKDRPKDPEGTLLSDDAASDHGGEGGVGGVGGVYRVKAAIVKRGNANRYRLLPLTK